MIDPYENLYRDEEIGDEESGGEAPSRPLAGQHAIVTGASRGIGRAIAHQLAALGADLTLLSRDHDRLAVLRDEICVRHEVSAFEVVADATDLEQVTSAFEYAENMHGAPSILVNNAGILESGPFPGMDHEQWLRVIDVNLHGTYLCTHRAVPLMIEAGYGRIINIASTAGQKGYPFAAAYCASKHAVVGLTRSLAVELARKNITVNAVCPGYTDTDMAAGIVDKITEATSLGRDAALKEVTAAIPLGRMVAPEEVAGTVGWLALPTAAAVTGQCIGVNGGEVM